jgi:hypothetical protein
MAIDNIFIDLSRNFTKNSLINGLSDHDAQLVIANNVIIPVQEATSMYARNDNSYTIDEFLSCLSNESWENIFGGSDTNVIFNNFLLEQLVSMFHKKKTQFQTQIQSMDNKRN